MQEAGPPGHVGAGRELCKRAVTHFPPGRRRLALGSLHGAARHGTARHCTALHCITLHSIVLHCTALPCLALPSTALCSFMLHCAALHGSLHFIAFARYQQMLKLCQCV